MRAIWLAAIAGLVIGAMAGKKKSPAAANGRPCPWMKTARVMLLGDSLAVGLAPPMGELAAGCGTPFDVNAAVGAHVTDINQGKLAALLAGFRPTHVLISLGGNDFQRTDPERVHEAINRLVQQIRLSGALALWIAPPMMPFEDMQVRNWWIDSNIDSYFNTPGVKELEAHRAADQIHYTPAGYRMLASMIWQWANKYFVAEQAQ